MTSKRKTGKKIQKRKGAAELFSLSMHQKKSLSERGADFLTDSFGTIAFFNINAVLFIGWLLVNANIIPGFTAFDPYPFGMLTMVVSLEAIFLSIIVLISQNRAAKIADLREEIDLQVNVAAEQEITQILSMLEGIEKKLSIKELHAADLARMKEVLDLVSLEKKVVKELGQ